MAHMRPLVPALALYFLTFLACVGLASAPAGCGGSQRQKTLHGTVIALNAARDGFIEIDSQKQEAIVKAATSKEEGQKALDAYRVKRQEVIAAFEAAYRVTALAATSTDDVTLKQALEAATALQKLYDAFKGGK